jgi:hypothetical protein
MIVYNETGNSLLVHVPVLQRFRERGRKLDEPARRQVSAIAELIQQSPKPGESTPYKTTVRILITRDQLYRGWKRLLLSRDDPTIIPETELPAPEAPLDLSQVIRLLRRLAKRSNQHVVVQNGLRSGRSPRTNLSVFESWWYLSGSRPRLIPASCWVRTQ